MAKKKAAKKPRMAEFDDVLQLHGIIGDLRNEIAGLRMVGEIDTSFVQATHDRLVALEYKVFSPPPVPPRRGLFARLFRRR